MPFESVRLTTFNKFTVCVLVSWFLSSSITSEHDLSLALLLFEDSEADLTRVVNKGDLLLGSRIILFDDSIRGFGAIPI